MLLDFECWFLANTYHSFFLFSLSFSSLLSFILICLYSHFNNPCCYFFFFFFSLFFFTYRRKEIMSFSVTFSVHIFHSNVIELGAKEDEADVGPQGRAPPDVHTTHGPSMSAIVVHR